MMVSACSGRGRLPHTNAAVKVLGSIAGERECVVQASIRRSIRESALGSASQQGADDDDDVLRIPRVQWTGLLPMLPPKFGAALMLVITQDEGEFQHIREEATGHGMMVVPGRFADAACIIRKGDTSHRRMHNTQKALTQWRCVYLRTGTMLSVPW